MRVLELPGGGGAAPPGPVGIPSAGRRPSVPGGLSWAHRRVAANAGATARRVILEPHSTIHDRYRVQERIAGGGMGEVWRAVDLVLARPVAIKVLRPEHAEDPAFQARFRAEARHAAGLSHPGITAVHDYGEVTDPGGRTAAFLVMELVEGASLARVLAGEGRLAPGRALDVLAQAGAALQAAHDAGVVHRDVKPANLLVRPDGTLKVTDFGIARAADSATLTRTGAVIGSPHYLSPEQANGQRGTAASDVYALGVVGYECLAGRRPFVADHPAALIAAHRDAAPPPLPPDVPADVGRLVLSALRKRPADRPRSAGELGREAQRLRDGARRSPRRPVPSPTPAAVSPTQRIPRPRRSVRRGALAALGAAAIALAVALVVTQPGGAPLPDRAPGASVPTSGSEPAPSDTVPAPTAPPSTAPAPIGSSPAPKPPGSPTPPARSPSRYIGRPYREVAAALRARGISVELVFSMSTLGAPAPGTVYELHPATNLRRGSRVRLLVEPS